MIDGGRARKNTLYVGNLASTMAYLGGEAARFDRRVFNVADPEARSMRQIAEAVAAAAGVKLRAINLPKWLLAGPALVGDLAGKIVGKEMPLSTRRLRVMTSDAVVDVSRLHEALAGGVEYVSFEEGMKQYLSGPQSPL